MFISLLSIFFFTKTSLGSIVCSERLLPGLSDDKITASSMFHSGFQPAYARLNRATGRNWCKGRGDKTPYIQVKMDATTVGGIITQGEKLGSFWVKRYHVRYSEDGVNWTFVKEPSGSEKVFIGNSDQNTWVTNKFNAGIRLQILRIYPIECHGWCCLRFDVIGCQATGLMTTTAMTESVQGLTTFTEKIKATPTRYAPFDITTMKILLESSESKNMSSTKKELSTLIDVLPFASSKSSTQSMTSMTPNSCGETLNEGNATTEPLCYMACSKNHTEQELVEMVDKLKQELKKIRRKLACTSDLKPAPVTKENPLLPSDLWV